MLDEHSSSLLTKKRGRRPTGTKLVSSRTVDSTTTPIVSTPVVVAPTPAAQPVAVVAPRNNVVLHLKCRVSELRGGCDEEGNDEEKGGEDHGEDGENEEEEDDDDAGAKRRKTKTHRDIWRKLRTLNVHLHHNVVPVGSRCACFWDTCTFDNPPIYIPKFKVHDGYHVYGYFCSPECATAYLMAENIDASTKFERYHLLNYLYGDIYDYTKNINPAPEPRHILDKFGGLLTIQDYRALLPGERIFLVVDKPLTRVLPELHEDNHNLLIHTATRPKSSTDAKPLPEDPRTQPVVVSATNPHTPYVIQPFASKPANRATILSERFNFVAT